MTQEEACDALGVRKQTLYAYVSRGQIEVIRDPAHTGRKLYRGFDIAALLRRRNLGRARKDIAASTMAWGEPIISTRISTIERGTLYYKGQNAVRLAQWATLEDVASLLWDCPAPPVFPTCTALPAITSVRARAFCALGIAAADRVAINGLDRGSLREVAARLVGRLASSFVELPAIEVPLHLRIATAWKCEEHADLLRRALVLLADQELTSSAFAARVAASTGAALGACAVAGLAALSGPRHGDAIIRVRALVHDAQTIGVEAAVRKWTAGDAALPGFGHELYPQGDPRAADLLAVIPVSSQVSALIGHVFHRTGLRPSIDVALNVLADHCRLPEDAVFALFAIGRSVGWMAHSLEQVSSEEMLRPRARYIGPSISDDSPPVHEGFRSSR